jgi:type VI secretion system protein VasD
MSKPHWRIALFALLALLLLGCAPKKPDTPKPTMLDLRITAAKDANANAAGKGQPVQLSLYQLAPGNSFSQADFFSLQKDAAATLGKQLLGTETYSLAPGGAKIQTLKAADGTQFVGVAVAFQQIDSADWQAYKRITTGATNQVKISIGKQSVEIQ